MLLYYHQCLHTSHSVLVEQIVQFTNQHMRFINDQSSMSSSIDFQYIFQQMFAHPLMRVWNINTIDLGTQIILHIQRQIQIQEKFTRMEYQIDQVRLFEQYAHNYRVELCLQSSRIHPLSRSVRQYQDLFISSLLTDSNSSIVDDIDNLLSNRTLMPMIYSSIRHVTDLYDLIQFIVERNIVHNSNRTDIDQLLSNFTRDLQQSLLYVPIVRNDILQQCQLLLHYYLHFRSLNNTHTQAWFDYISSSIIHLIVHSWSDDAIYTCLYTTIVQHNQLEIISYWQAFLNYARQQQIEQNSLSIVTVEIRLVDFLQLDRIFRFLFADQCAHYCNLMIYEYAPKLLPFISIFHRDIQTNLKQIWQRTLQDRSHLYKSKRFESTTRKCN
jgi:hypothetical protein